MRRNRPVSKAITGLLLATVLLCSMEVVLRLVEPLPPAAHGGGTFMVPHPTRGWAMAPGFAHTGATTAQIDSDGNRHCPDAPGPLVLTLGDSSIFGHGLGESDTLHAAMGAALADQGVPARVCTIAVPGYSILQSRTALEEAGWARSPSLLIIAQLWSDNNHDWFQDAALLDRLRAPSAIANRLLRGSATFRLLSALLGRPAAHTVAWQERFHGTESATDAPATRSSEAGQKRKIKGPRRVPLPAYAAALSDVLATAGERKVAVILLLPANRRLLQGEPGPWDPYRAVLAEIGEKAGVPVVDARPILESEIARGTSLDRLFLDELHPSAPAQRALGGALAQAARAAGLLLAPPTRFPRRPEGVVIPEDPYAEGPTESRSLQARILAEQEG
jgi:hypothetical protein